MDTESLRLCDVVRVTAVTAATLRDFAIQLRQAGFRLRFDEEGLMISDGRHRWCMGPAGGRSLNTIVNTFWSRDSSLPPGVLSDRALAVFLRWIDKSDARNQIRALASSYLKEALPRLELFRLLKLVDEAFEACPNDDQDDERQAHFVCILAEAAGTRLPWD
jgi:hypothetical protein